MDSLKDLVTSTMADLLASGTGRPAATLALGLLIATIAVLFHRAVTHPLARVPGPFLAKFTGLWRTYHYMRGNWHSDILLLHRRYGPVVRIAPDELSLVDAAATKQLYGHGTAAPKTDWYHTWDAGAPAPGFFAARDRHLHAFLRRRVAAAYAMTTLLRNETHVQRCVDLLLQRLGRHAAAGRAVNMADWTNALAFDVVGELAYGAPLGHLETESDVLGIRKGVFRSFFVMATFGHLPGQSRIVGNPVVRGFMRLLGQDLFNSFEQWATERVQKRMDGSEQVEREDMLTHFIRMKTAQGEPVSQAEVLIEALNILAAGADTTSIAMRSTLYYLRTHPTAYAKLQDALDAYHETHNLGPDKPITYTQTQQIPYLVAVCKEAMRLLPSITYQLLRHAPPGGLEVAGFRIPEGTQVGVSPIAANRDPEVWGPDAEEFVPERWLSGDEAEIRRLEGALMTWGGNGPRMCVGKNLALIEVHKVVAQLLRHFDVEFVDPEKPWRITTFWFSYQHDMHMWIKPREGIPLPVAS